MIQGKYRKLYIELSATWVPIGCLSSNALNEENEIFDTTVRTDGGYKSVVPLTTSYSVSFSGIVKNSIGDSTVISLDRLRGLMRDRTLLKWKMEDDLGQVFDLGFGYLTDLADAASVGEFITFQGTITGSGKLYNIEDFAEFSVPVAPVARFVEVDSSSLEIEWDKPFSDLPITEYKIYRDDVFYASVLPTQTSYVDTGVQTGGIYGYNVSAVNDTGESALSNRVGNAGSPVPDGGFNYFIWQDTTQAVFQDNSSIVL